MRQGTMTVRAQEGFTVSAPIPSEQGRWWLTELGDWRQEPDGVASVEVSESGAVSLLSAPGPSVDTVRRLAYSREADPLFFKSQRGSASEKEWADKVEEIKSRHPLPPITPPDRTPVMPPATDEVQDLVPDGIDSLPIDD